MIDFKYTQPNTLKSAVKALSKSSVPSSGGTDLLGLLKNDIISPSQVVNLKNIKGLDKIEKVDNGIKIGALTHLTEIVDNELINKNFTVLAQAAGRVGSPQLRNMGTIGGNLTQRPRCWYFGGDFHCLKKGGDMCYAEIGQNKYHAIIDGGPCHIVHPSDTAVALLALNAVILTYSKSGEKRIPISDFFTLPDKDVTVENVLADDEIITHIEIPLLPNGTSSAYLKFTERGSWDFALVSVAAVINHNNNKINSGRLAFGGVAPIPWNDDELDKKLGGLTLKTDSLMKFSKSVLTNADPLEYNEYKIQLARGLTVEVLSKFS